jgi:dolichol-phosphate mannosyltransferase
MHTQGLTSVSIVIPCYNEELAIPHLISRLHDCISNTTNGKKNRYIFEILFVDDGSKDKTYNVIEAAAPTSKDISIRCLKLNRNYGHMAAIEAGLAETSSNLVITMDADLQDPPEIISKLIEKWEETGADVIQAVRSSRETDTLFKKITASMYYRFIKRITGVDIISNAADFRLMTRTAVKIIMSLPEKHKIFRLLIPALGLKTEKIYFARDSRVAGRTKYNLPRMLNLTTDSVIAFSSKPLRLIGIIGLLGFIFFALLFLYALVSYIYFDTVSGWTSLVFLILTANSFLLGAVGLIGEYVGRIYESSLKRPRYLIEKNLTIRLDQEINNTQERQ